MRFKIKFQTGVDKNANKMNTFWREKKQTLDTHFKSRNSYVHRCQNENNTLDQKNGLEMTDFIKIIFLTRFSLNESSLN